MYDTAALTNTFSDVFILLLPIPLILQLHLVTKHKIAVIAILLTGSIVIVAGIGRTVAYFSYRNLTNSNYSSDYYALVIWTSLEPTLGIVGACLPCIRPAFRGWSPESVLRSVRSALSLRSLRSAGSDMGKDGLGEESKRVNGIRGGGGGEASESTKGFTRMIEEEEDVELEHVGESHSPGGAGGAKSAAMNGKRDMTHSYARHAEEGGGGYTEVDLENGNGNGGIHV